MHVEEIEIDEVLVRRLLVEQFPEWAGLPLRRVAPAGTVHAVFRLGDELAVRLPRVEWAASRLPPSAPLPLDVPVPVGAGRPSAGYSRPWSVLTWVDGDTVAVDDLDVVQAARDLAAFVAAVQQLDPAGAPTGRGVPLAQRDAGVRHWFERFDDERATAAWERALAAPPWDGEPVWHHGDLDVRNWLVRDGRITGVIDWDTAGVGDPACDVAVAWKLHSAAARDAFRAALPTDDATWERARGWVVSQCVAVLGYYTPQSNPALYGEAERWLELALADYAAASAG